MRRRYQSVPRPRGGRLARTGWGIVAVLLTTMAAADTPTLRLTAYCTAGSARELLEPEARDASLVVLESFGISGFIIETNRGDQALSEEELRTLRDFYTDAGYRVSGGIATVPGAEWGVRANEGLAWLNYEAVKTQQDLEAAMRAGARVFDRFIVDDFLLTGDKSAESDAARRGRTWGEYRRDLLTALSQRIFIGPAREENPDITMVLKFPQSYDRYHTFGYDVERQPQLYDQLWVGTETRGQYTQRFGFTQPYEGFVNYRWIDSLGRGKLGGAWFDHGDCDGPDFVEQAWQTVLAGAPEIVLFNYANLASEHPGHALLRNDYEGLVSLAKVIQEQPVTGVAAYKPPNSDPGSDMYIMDFIGMLGVPVVPVSTFPDAADAVLLPAYAAEEPGIVARIERTVMAGKRVTITAGLLAGVEDQARLARLAGVAPGFEVDHLRTEAVLLDGEPVAVPRGLDVRGRIDAVAADVLLTALAGDAPVPFLTTRQVGSGTLSVLNLHMFTWEDFEAANEVLLSPRNLGLLDIPRAWANTLRQAMGGGGEMLSDAPTRVAFQPMGDSGWFIQNYNTEPALITVGSGDASLGALRNGFTGEQLLQKGNVMQRELAARSRLWIAR